jgi:hypothetical protein
LKLHIENSATPGIFFEPMVKVSARWISTIDFTVFKGQSEAGTDNISAGPGATASTRYEWSAPTPHALFFEGLGGSAFDTRLSVRESVLSATTSAQPGSPIRGDRYILPIGAVGTAWGGNDRKIATWNGSSWNFETPEKGWICYSDGDADYCYMNDAYESGGTWVTGLTTGSGAIGFEFDAADTARRYDRIVVSGWLGDWADFTGNFSLNIKEVDGAGTQTSSESRFNTLGGVSTTPNIRLRELAGDGYTIIEGQSSGGEAVLAYTGTKNMVFSPTCPTDVAFSIDSMGRILSPSVSDPLLWGTDTTFDLEIADGSNRPSSFFKSYPAVPSKDKPRALSLRQLVGTGYTIIRDQTSGGPGVNVPGANGFVFTPSDFLGLSSDPTLLDFDAMGAVTSCDCANWNQNGTFTLSINDGSRPVSIVTGRALSLRSLVPEILTVPNNGGAGSINLQVGGDAGPWDWFDYQDGLTNSVLTAPDTFESSTLSVSWAAGALESGETGTGTVTIQRSDGSSPASTVALETTVNEAPQMPVSCWPILAAILAVIAVVLIRSQRKRTLH